MQPENGAEETLKELEAQLPDAMPAIAPASVEALAKEMAKSGQDVTILQSFAWPALASIKPPKRNC
jgi:hypothetical protein